PVVVAEAYLGGRDRIVLVDDRDDAERQQPVERRRRVQVAPPLLHVAQRDENLRGGELLCVEQLGPDVAQGDLPGRGGGLRVLEVRAAAFGEAEPPRAERDRARGDNRDPLPGGVPLRDIGDDAG